MVLPLPDFRVDLAGILYGPARLTAHGFDRSDGFQFQLDSETGGRYGIETSSNLTEWATLLRLTNSTGTTLMTEPAAEPTTPRYYRAMQLP